jgi:hypothetical protein
MSRKTLRAGGRPANPGYASSQRIRKCIEESFGWIKTGLGRPSLRGVDRIGWAFTFAAAAYNLVRLPKLPTEATG